MTFTANKTQRGTSKNTSKLDDGTWKGSEFARRLRAKRERLNISQENLAKNIGVSNTTIQNYESGQYPKGEHAIALAQYLKCSLDWLLMGQSPTRAEEADSQAQRTAYTSPADEPPRAQVDESLKQMAVANERLWQMMDRERELMKEVGELKAENARLKERVAAREQTLREMRDLYEMQEADVGLEETSADIALTKASTSSARGSSSSE